jgi:hypothetical protein
MGYSLIHDNNDMPSLAQLDDCQTPIDPSPPHPFLTYYAFSIIGKNRPKIAVNSRRKWIHFYRLIGNA